MMTRIGWTALSALIMTVTLVLGACGDEDQEDTGSIAGHVLGAANAPLAGAQVTAAGASATSAADGAFRLDELAAGDAKLVVQADWYQTSEQTATVIAGETTQKDVPLSVRSLQVQTADQNLANTYNATFSWDRQTSIAVVSRPTRAQFEKGIYDRNPALRVNSSAEPAVTVSAFSFPMPDDATKQALVLASIVNRLDDTPLSPAEKQDALVWRAGVGDFLVDWDFNASAALYNAGLAVRGQKWGGASTIAPQNITLAYLDVSTSEIWIEVAFEPFVQFGAGLPFQPTDTNGDTLVEIYAKIDPLHVGAAAFAQLRDNYLSATPLDTLALASLLNHALDELYSITNPSLASSIGVPYAIASVGTVNYPFAVVKHMSGVVNVLLVAPGQ